MITNDKQRNNIQLLRGIAILAVVLIHNTPAGLSQVFIRPFLNFAVGLFLFLSGLLSNAENWKPLKRIKKILIPYVIWTVVYSVIKNVNNPSDIPALFVKNLLTGNSAAMMYYVFIYCEFAILIPVIDKLAKSKYRFVGFLIAPLEIIFMRTIPLVTGWYEINSYVEVLQSISCLGWFTYFYLGYSIGNNLISIKKSAVNWMTLWSAGILLQFAEGYWLYSKGMANCGTQLKLSAIFTGVCFLMLAYEFIKSEKEYNNKILKYLGDNSFGIYFSHMAVISLFTRVQLYSEIVIYPLNAIVVIVVDLFFIYIGKKILRKYSKYLAL